jgi:hypothetical protein
MPLRLLHSCYILNQQTYSLSVCFYPGHDIISIQKHLIDWSESFCDDDTVNNSIDEWNDGRLELQVGDHRARALSSPVLKPSPDLVNVPSPSRRTSKSGLIEYFLVKCNLKQQQERV